MEQYLHISGSIPAPDAGVILFSRPESVVAQGKTWAGEDVFCTTEPQCGYQRHPWSGIVARNNSVPQGRAVAWDKTERPRAKKKMCPELEHLIDQVLVPILVERYVNRLKHLTLNCGIAQ